MGVGEGRTNKWTIQRCIWTKVLHRKPQFNQNSFQHTWLWVAVQKYMEYVCPLTIRWSLSLGFFLLKIKSISKYDGGHCLRSVLLGICSNRRMALCSEFLFHSHSLRNDLSLPDSLSDHGVFTGNLITVSRLHQYSIIFGPEN